MRRRLTARVLLLCCVAAAFSTPALTTTRCLDVGQEFPQRPVRLPLPYQSTNSGFLIEAPGQAPMVQDSEVDGSGTVVRPQIRSFRQLDIRLGFPARSVTLTLAAHKPAIVFGRPLGPEPPKVIAKGVGVPRRGAVEVTLSASNQEALGIIALAGGDVGVLKICARD